MRLILSLILSLAAGALVGVGLYFLDLQGFYLVVAMPILTGTIVGFATALPLLKRNPPVVPIAIIALIGGLLAMGVYWVLQYNAYNEQLIETVRDSDPRASDEEVAEIIADYQQDEFNATGLPAFIAEYAEVGFGIGRVTSGDSNSIEIKGNLAYIYWAVEIIIVAIAAIGTAVGRTRQEAVMAAQPA
jgi:hypothetical protein